MWAVVHLFTSGEASAVSPSDDEDDDDTLEKIPHITPPNIWNSEYSPASGLLEEGAWSFSGVVALFWFLQITWESSWFIMTAMKNIAILRSSSDSLSTNFFKATFIEMTLSTCSMSFEVWPTQPLQQVSQSHHFTTIFFSISRTAVALNTFPPNSKRALLRGFSLLWISTDRLRSSSTPCGIWTLYSEKGGIKEGRGWKKGWFF